MMVSKSDIGVISLDFDNTFIDFTLRFTEITIKNKDDPSSLEKNPRVKVSYNNLIKICPNFEVIPREKIHTKYLQYSYFQKFPGEDFKEAFEDYLKAVQLTSNFFKDAPLFKGIIENLTNLKKEGYKIVLLSSLPFFAFKNQIHEMESINPKSFFNKIESYIKHISDIIKNNKNKNLKEYLKRFREEYKQKKLTIKKYGNLFDKTYFSLGTKRGLESKYVETLRKDGLLKENKKIAHIDDIPNAFSKHPSIISLLHKIPDNREFHKIEEGVTWTEPILK